MTDLARVHHIYAGSNGDATKALYVDLEKLGPVGIIALNLFRACKCSERAKMYRPGRGYKAEAYRRKDWSIENLSSALYADEWHGLELSWGWSIDQDLRDRGDPHHHILYVDLPTGQVSFHCGSRYHGPDYSGSWDGVRDQAAERICRFVADVFKLEPATP